MMNTEQRKQLLREYMATPRVSGYEAAMAYRFRDDLAPYADEVRIDNVGNVIATFTGARPGAPADGVRPYGHHRLYRHLY